MRIAAVLGTLLAAWHAGAAQIWMYTDSNCANSGAKELFFQTIPDCQNKGKLRSSWKSYKVHDRASNEPEKYIRTFNKKDCYTGQDTANSCHDIGPKGGLKVNQCVTIAASDSVLYNDKPCS